MNSRNIKPCRNALSKLIKSKPVIRRFVTNSSTLRRRELFHSNIQALFGALFLYPKGIDMTDHKTMYECAVEFVRNLNTRNERAGREDTAA